MTQAAMELFRQPNIASQSINGQDCNESGRCGERDISMSIVSAPSRLDEVPSGGDNTDQEQSKMLEKLPPINVFFAPHRNKHIPRRESDAPSMLFEPVSVPQHLLSQNKTIVVLPPPIIPPESPMMMEGEKPEGSEDQLQFNFKRQVSSGDADEGLYWSLQKKAKM